MQLRSFLHDEIGATAIEYSIIASLLALAILTSLSIIGNTLDTVFSSVATHMTGN